MELTPQLLETQQFPEKFRGYDCDAVDDFLERVGVGVADLLQQLGDANKRVSALEQAGPSAAPAPAPAPVAAAPAAVDQISRALVLAQKAADDTVTEAHIEGRRLVAAAETQAASLVATAQTQAAELRTTAQAEAQETAGRTRREADQLLVEAKSVRADAESEQQRMRVEVLDSAQAEADRLLDEARSRAGALVDEAELNATRALQIRQTELAVELEELEKTVRARRGDARTLTDLVSARRETLSTVARELEALGERLEDVSDDDSGGGGSVTAGEERAADPSGVIDLVAPIHVVAEPEPAPEPVAMSTTTSWATDNRPSTAHPAGSEGGATLPRWATIDGAEDEATFTDTDTETAPEVRPDLHVVEPQAAPDPAAVELAPLEQAPPPAVASPMPAPSVPRVSEVPSTVAPERVDRSDADAIDDPFLAALRGREPLRGDEPDDDGARRRRRRRR